MFSIISLKRLKAHYREHKFCIDSHLSPRALGEGKLKVEPVDREVMDILFGDKVKGQACKHTHTHTGWQACARIVHTLPVSFDFQSVLFGVPCYLRVHGVHLVLGSTDLTCLLAVLQGKFLVRAVDELKKALERGEDEVVVEALEVLEDTVGFSSSCLRKKDRPFLVPRPVVEDGIECVSLQTCRFP